MSQPADTPPGEAWTRYFNRRRQSMIESVTIPSGSARIHCVTAGAGPAIVLLHAGVADHRMWRDQIEDLQDRFQVIAYDRREFGQTHSPDEPFRHIDDLAVVLEKLDVGSAILVGCSQGGRIAIDFALAHPERVPALVLASTAITGAPAAPVPAGVEALSDALDAAEEAGNLDRVNAIEAHLWLDGPLCAEGRVSGPIRDLFLDMNGTALRKPEIPKEEFPPDAYQRLSELAMPVLLISGDLDFDYIRARHAQLARTLSNAQAVEMPGTAHLPSLEQPDLFNRHLLAFLETMAD